jgi:hypothetical protein
VAIEAVIHQVLQLPADERVELVERLIDSLDEDDVEILADELAQLDEAISDADQAVERGELIPADAVLAHSTRTIYELAGDEQPVSISQDEVIKTLDLLAGSLGPLMSQAERLERQDRWVDNGGVELFEALVGLVASPPMDAQLQHANLDDWSTLLVEVAGTLGKRHPEVALSRLLPLLEDDQARAAAIDILGGVGDVRAVPALGRLMVGGRLGEDELVHLAGALGEIGGDEACRQLAQLRQALTPGQSALQQEIEIAAQAAHCE